MTTPQPEDEQPPSAEELWERSHQTDSARARADGERDALALLAVSAASTWDSSRALAIMNNTDWPCTCAVLLDCILELLAELGADPAEWVRQKQAELVARLAEDDG
jgi:hypothetical protein